MPTQMIATGGSRRRRPYVDDLNARLQRLPNMLQAEQEQKNAAAQQDYWNRDIELKKADQIGEANWRNQQIGMKQAEMDFAERQARQNMGLQALTLGANLSMNPGNKTIGNVGKATGNLFGRQIAPTGTGFFGGLKDVNLGNVVAGGLTGYGAANMFGGGKKNKFKNAAIGTGAGLLSNFLSSGKFSYGNALGSGFGGLVGGLFS